MLDRADLLHRRRLHATSLHVRLAKSLGSSHVSCFHATAAVLWLSVATMTVRSDRGFFGYMQHPYRYIERQLRGHGRCVSHCSVNMPRLYTFILRCVTRFKNWDHVPCNACIRATRVSMPRLRALDTHWVVAEYVEDLVYTS